MKSSRPYQYIKGWVEFYKLKFKVTPDVLIPRPESELLVDEVIRFANHPERAKQVEGSFIVLDLGTGSGNIAISIAKNTPQVKIIATDISKAALKIAKQNAKLHGVEKRIKFIQSDLLPVIPAKAGIQIIVANLPYIPTDRIPYLDSSVKDFEPHIALDGGEDGFELYRKLFQQIQENFFSSVIPNKVRNLKIKKSRDLSLIVRDDNWLKLIICEIDYTHGDLALHEAQKYFPNAQIEIKTDLAHKQRILIIQMEAHLK